MELPLLKAKLERIAKLAEMGLAVSEAEHEAYPNRVRLMLADIEATAKVPGWPL